MSCKFCQPSLNKNPDNPFKAGEELSDLDHEGVFIGECQFCKNSAIIYWVDIYDDYWSFWSIISADEMNLILSKKSENEFHDFIRDFLKKKVILENHPVHGYCWVNGDTCLFQGPSW